MFATGDVFKMLVFYSVLVRQYDNIQVFFRCQYVSTLSTAMFSCILVFYSVLIRQYAQYGYVLCMLVFYSVLISTLVRLVRPCSMHVCISTLSTNILFGLSTAMFYVCWNFIRSLCVSTLSTAMFSCMLVFYSVLVRLVRPCSMYVGILFGLSTLSTDNFSIFMGMHAWLSSALPQSTACKKDS